jgi:DNA topoisomerase-1
MVVAEVARRLGNTPAVCRKAYIHPAVLALGDHLATEAGRAALLAERWVRSPPPVRGLALAERQLMGLLRRRPARPNA